MDVKAFKALVARQQEAEQQFHQLVAARDELHKEIFETLGDYIDSQIVVDDSLYFIEALPSDSARIALHGAIVVFKEDT